MRPSHDTECGDEQERIEIGHKLTIPPFIFPDTRHQRIYNVPIGDWYSNTEFFEGVERTDTDLTVVYCGEVYGVLESDFLSAERLNEVIFAEARVRPVTMQVHHWEQFAKYLLGVVLQ